MTHEAFAQAVRAYGDTVYRVAYHALNNPSDAEDVMQTVLLRLYEYKKDFESDEHMKHWLLRVTVNESRKVLRSFWRRTSAPLEEWQEAAAQSAATESSGYGPGAQVSGGCLPILL